MLFCDSNVALLLHLARELKIDLKISRNNVTILIYSQVHFTQHVCYLLIFKWNAQNCNLLFNLRVFFSHVSSHSFQGIYRSFLENSAHTSQPHIVFTLVLTPSTYMCEHLLLRTECTGLERCLYILTEHTSLPEDSSSILSTHVECLITTCNLSFSGLQRHLYSNVHAQIQAQTQTQTALISL